MVNQGSMPIIWTMAAILRDSTTVAAVVRTQLRAILLAMIITRKSIHGFSRRPFGPPELR